MKLDRCSLKLATACVEPMISYCSNDDFYIRLLSHSLKSFIGRFCYIQSIKHKVLLDFTRMRRSWALQRLYMDRTVFTRFFLFGEMRSAQQMAYSLVTRWHSRLRCNDQSITQSPSSIYSIATRFQLYFGRLQQLHQLTISFGKQKATMHAYCINPSIDPTIEVYLDDSHHSNQLNNYMIAIRAQAYLDSHDKFRRDVSCYVIHIRDTVIHGKLQPAVMHVWDVSRFIISSSSSVNQNSNNARANVSFVQSSSCKVVQLVATRNIVDGERLWLHARPLLV